MKEYMPEPGVFTPKQAGAYLNLGENKVRDLCASGELKAARAGLKWKIPKAMCDRYIMSVAEKGAQID